MDLSDNKASKQMVSAATGEGRARKIFFAKHHRLRDTPALAPIRVELDFTGHEIFKSNYTFLSDAEISGTAVLRLWVQAQNQIDVDFLFKLEKSRTETELPAQPVDHLAIMAETGTGYLRAAKRAILRKEKLGTHGLLSKNLTQTLSKGNFTALDIELGELKTPVQFRAGDQLALLISAHPAGLKLRDKQSPAAACFCDPIRLPALDGHFAANSTLPTRGRSKNNQPQLLGMYFGGTHVSYLVIRPRTVAAPVTADVRD